MYLERLSIRQFRSISQVALHIHAPFVVFHGDNGQGKTTCLEALYIAATGRSFKSGNVSQWIQYNHSESYLEAVCVRQGVRHDVAVKITPKGRQMRVDGRALQRVGALLGLMNVVAFFPDDLRIVKGTPEERRRFLDRAVANCFPDFLGHALAYDKVLRTRNTLLRAPAPPDKTLLGIYNAQLVEYGLLVDKARMALLEQLLPKAQERYAFLMGAHPKTMFKASWCSGLPLEVSHPDAALAYAEALEKTYPKDRARGSTSVGPHRGDVVFSLENAEARHNASQGQQRAMVLGLKLAEVETLTARLGESPMVLLDDVSSELDMARTHALFDCLTHLGSHIWLTTTGTVSLPYPSNAQSFHVSQGSVVESLKTG